KPQSRGLAFVPFRGAPMAASSPDFLPTASLAALRLRAELLDEVRRFFRKRGYLQVETPVPSHDTVVDAHLDPLCIPRPPCPLRAFVIPGAAAQPHDLFLQTSPEFHMKRLLAAGATAIFQVARVMRRGELGRLHNPEFTMVEWYRVGDSHVEQMECVEALVRAV